MQLKPALPTGSGSSERRSGERRRVRLLARARGGDRTYTLEIMDISKRGMLLRGAVPLDQGDKVEIELSDRAEDNIIATVAWAAGENLGCYLERALTPAELAHAALRARPSNLVNDPIGQEILQAFGARIRQLRRASDLTMLELGKIVGVSKPTVWKWESGKARPREGALDALAQAPASIRCRRTGRVYAAAAGARRRCPGYRGKPARMYRAVPIPHCPARRRRSFQSRYNYRLGLNFFREAQERFAWVTIPGRMPAPGAQPPSVASKVTFNQVW